MRLGLRCRAHLPALVVAAKPLNLAALHQLVPCTRVCMGWKQGLPLMHHVHILSMCVSSQISMILLTVIIQGFPAHIEPGTCRTSLVSPDVYADTQSVYTGAEVSKQAAENCTEATAPPHAEPASSSSRAVDVAVQTDADLLEHPSSSALGIPPSQLRSPDSSAASAHPARQTAQQPAEQDAVQQGSKDSLEASVLTADVHEKEEEAQASQQAMHRSQDAGCDARSDAESASDTGSEPTLRTSAGHSSANSSRSSSSGSVRHKNAGRAVRSSTNAAKHNKMGISHGSVQRGASQTAVAADRQQDDAVSVQAQDRVLPIEAGVQGQQRKAKGKADGRLSRGLQLPQKLSIASLAKHAGVDKAFMQVGDSQLVMP